MSAPVLPDDLPERRNHVLIAVLSVATISILLYIFDCWLTECIAKEIALAPKGESTWSRQLTIVKAVVENLIAGALGTLILALIVRWIIMFVDPRDRVLEISPNAITSRLRTNAQSTRKYVFLGNTATFVTATAVPILVDLARQTGIPRTIALYMIDPMDMGAVASYAAYKTQVAHSNSIVADQTMGRWVTPQDNIRPETDDQVIAKLLAAIYLATFASLQSAVTVSIYLRRSFTPFRADMTDKEVVLTQESRIEPGVAFSSRGHFYGWYHKEADAQLMQATRLDLEGNRSALQNLNLVSPYGTESAIRASLISVVLLFPHLSPLSNRHAVIDLAIKRIKNPSHSY